MRAPRPSAPRPPRRGGAGEACLTSVSESGGHGAKGRNGAATTMQIAIIYYGMGNLRSVEKAFYKVGASAAFVIDDPAQVAAADKAGLPGDGASTSPCAPYAGRAWTRLRGALSRRESLSSASASGCRRF